MTEAPTKYEEGIANIVQLLDTATRDTHGGKYWNIDTNQGLPSELPW